MRGEITLTRRAGLIGGAALTLSMTGAIRATDLVAGETGRVDRVFSGQSFRLNSGLSVRLAGIIAPDRDAPFGAQSKAGLESLILGKTVRLSYGGDPRDRYDRALAQVHLLNPDESLSNWIQAELVQQGLARVYSWPDDHYDIDRLYAVERTARANRAGLWGEDAYAIRRPDPDPLAQYVDSLQLVEGIITRTADVRGQIYLNFGADYRTDFTVAIAKRHRKRFKSLNPVSLEGARVRVRGWIELYNGPMIWLSHPERMEILS